MYSSTFIREGNSIDLGRAVENTLNNLSKYNFELISTQMQIVGPGNFYCLIVYDTHKKDV